jgi:hypothetical protein
MGLAVHLVVAADVMHQSEVYKGAVNPDYATHSWLPTLPAGLHHKLA